MKAVQDEASPAQAALRRKTPEAQDFLLAERKGVLRRNLLTATGELAKSAENKINNRVRLGSTPCPEL